MTTANLMDEWNELPWKQFEWQVFKCRRSNISARLGLKCSSNSATPMFK